ncbi:MAG: hypothetical protein EBT07_10760 [Actinobacteria bacterium]|nr:hypothetical protein [Actinomycetota bacterium]
MFALAEIATLLAVAFPSNAAAEDVLTGEEKLRAVTAVQPVVVSSVASVDGLRLVIAEELTLYQNVTMDAVVLPPFRHSSPV